MANRSSVRCTASATARDKLFRVAISSRVAQHSGIRSPKRGEALWIKVPAAVGIRNPTLPGIGLVRARRSG